MEGARDVPVIRKAYSGDGSRKATHFKPYLVRWTDAGGRQHEKSFTSKKEADDFRTKANHDKRVAPYADPRAGLVTFESWAQQWLGEHQGAAKSRVNYETALRMHVYRTRQMNWSLKLGGFVYNRSVTVSGSAR